MAAEPRDDGSGGGGVKRAAEMNDAMLSIPGYGDDSMFFAVRYFDRVKYTVRQKDFDEFAKNASALARLSMRPAEEVGGPTARSEKITELKAQTTALIEEFPELLRDFEPFLAAFRGALRATKGSKTS